MAFICDWKMKTWNVSVIAGLEEVGLGFRPLQPAIGRRNSSTYLTLIGQAPTLFLAPPDTTPN